jgi:hypothetical protein
MNAPEVFAGEERMATNQEMTMKWKKCALYLLAAGMISAGGSVIAGEQSGFAALSGIETQRLSTEEMQATTGQLTAAEIASALGVAATRVCSPALSAALTRAAGIVTTNATAINAWLGRFTF